MPSLLSSDHVFSRQTLLLFEILFSLREIPTDFPADLYGTVVVTAHDINSTQLDSGSLFFFLA